MSRRRKKDQKNRKIRDELDALPLSKPEVTIPQEYKAIQAMIDTLKAEQTSFFRRYVSDGGKAEKIEFLEAVQTKFMQNFQEGDVCNSIAKCIDQVQREQPKLHSAAVSSWISTSKVKELLDSLEVKEAFTIAPSH